MRIDGISLTTTEDGQQAILCVLNGCDLTLRRCHNRYRVALEMPKARVERYFSHWRQAAIAFSMLFHTEKCLARLEGAA